MPALASLLGVAIDRERLTREALEAEALRRSDAMKTALLRAVSHDLRSPLMAILTAASALARDDSRARSGRPPRAARRPSRSRPPGSTVWSPTCWICHGSRRARRAPRPRCARSRISSVHALREVGDAESRIDVSLPDRSPPVRADVHQIERVLVNLIENAIKYSPEDEPVAVHVTRTPRSEVIVRVIDHGRGIPAEELEPSSSRSSADRPRPPARGAGLGLAIARGFAEANGGRVWAESRAGQGATFVLALPIGRRWRRSREPGRASWWWTTSRRSCARCAPACAAPATTSRRQTPPQGALAEAAMRPPDAVILDLILPDGTGTDVVPRAAHLELGTRDRALGGRRRAARRSPRSTPAPTTTSPSRSASTSCWPGCAPASGG